VASRLFNCLLAVTGAVGLAAGVAACKDQGVTQPTAAVPTNAPATAAPATADNTTSSTSTSFVTTPSTVTTTGATVTVLVTPTTLIRPADLVTDPNDPNNQHTVTPEQQPIVDAYRAAVEAENVTYSNWPLDAQSPGLVGGPFNAKVMGPIAAAIAERTGLNQVLDISGGLTLRPYVVEDNDGDPNRVFVWDCQIDATFWKDKDTGQKAPPDSSFPNVGSPGVELGVVAVMVNVGGRWLLDEGGLESRACA
jgi:hypothetical protein